MVEIISYLGNNGFAVYIDSACGFLTTRELVEGVIPIHSDRIIASDFVFTSTKMGKDKPGDHFYDRHKEKIVISGKPLVDNAKTVCRAVLQTWHVCRVSGFIFCQRVLYILANILYNKQDKRRREYAGC